MYKSKFLTFSIPLCVFCCFATGRGGLPRRARGDAVGPRGARGDRVCWEESSRAFLRDATRGCWILRTCV